MTKIKKLFSFWEKLEKYTLFQLFVSFLKISPSSFGGGYALIPIIEKEAVQQRKWLSEKEIADVFALAQSAPGAIALNSAIFIGYRMKGKLGALAALSGIILPTFLIMIFLSLLFLQVHDHPKVEAAFTAIRTTILALIVYAALKMGKQAIVNYAAMIICIAAVLALYFFSSWLHPIFIIVLGAIAGIAVCSRHSGELQQTKQEEKQQTAAQDDYSDYMI